MESREEKEGYRKTAGTTTESATISCLHVTTSCLASNEYRVQVQLTIDNKIIIAGRKPSAPVPDRPALNSGVLVSLHGISPMGQCTLDGTQIRRGRVCGGPLSTPGPFTAFFRYIFSKFNTTPNPGPLGLTIARESCSRGPGF